MVDGKSRKAGALALVWALLSLCTPAAAQQLERSPDVEELRRLEREGAALRLEDLRWPVREEANGAEELLALHGGLPPLTLDEELALEDFVGGRAGGPAPAEQWRAALPTVEAVFAARAGTLAGIERAARSRFLQFPLDATVVDGGVQRQARACNELNALLAARALLRARGGDVRAACRDAFVGLRLAAALLREPMLGSQSVALASIGAWTALLREVVARGLPPRNELVMLRARLDAFDLDAALEGLLDGERVRGLGVFAAALAVAADDERARLHADRGSFLRFHRRARELADGPSDSLDALVSRIEVRCAVQGEELTPGLLADFQRYRAVAWRMRTELALARAAVDLLRSCAEHGEYARTLGNAARAADGARFELMHRGEAVILSLPAQAEPPEHAAWVLPRP